jgi:molybdopterin-containing oxidoreductase family membrane subunit
MFWLVQSAGLIIPIILLVIKPFRKPRPLLLIAVVIVAGAFLKRYLIVTPTLLHPFLPVQNYPESFSHYHPTFSEIVITSGTFAIVALVITLFIKLFPIIPVCETAHEKGIDQETINN